MLWVEMKDRILRERVAQKSWYIYFLEYSVKGWFQHHGNSRVPSTIAFECIVEELSSNLSGSWDKDYIHWVMWINNLSITEYLLEIVEILSSYSWILRDSYHVKTYKDAGEYPSLNGYALTW